jgi:3-phosphoshikimate 1-carboxyvinyltransferase
MGANISPRNDGMEVVGTSKLTGAVVESYNDHRVAMSLAIAALCAEGTTTINKSDCIRISYPNFFKDIQSIC